MTVNLIYMYMCFANLVFDFKYCSYSDRHDQGGGDGGDDWCHIQIGGSHQVTIQAAQAGFGIWMGWQTQWGVRE